MRGPTYFALRARTSIPVPEGSGAPTPPVWTVTVAGSTLSGVTDPGGSVGSTVSQAWRSGLPGSEPTEVKIEWPGFVGIDPSPTRIDAAVDNDYPPAPDPL